MVLIQAGKQGGSKSGEAVFGGIFGSALNPVLVTLGAAVINVACHMADKVLQTVVFLNPDLHSDGWRVFQQAVPAGLILLPGMDIGIIPESHRFNALGTQRINAGEGAGGTAGV